MSDEKSPMYENLPKVPTIPYILHWVHALLAVIAKGGRPDEKEVREAMRMLQFLFALCGQDVEELEQKTSYFVKEEDIENDYIPWIYNYGSCHVLKPIVL